MHKSRQKTKQRDVSWAHTAGKHELPAQRCECVSLCPHFDVRHESGCLAEDALLLRLVDGEGVIRDAVGAADDGVADARDDVGGL